MEAVTRLRVATLNIWGRGRDWTARRPVMAGGFEALSPDLVTLQEVVVSDAGDQARDALGDGYHLVHQRGRESDGRGVTTASRWPVGEVLEVDLHVSDRTPDFACTTLITEILAPEPLGRIWLANHLPDW